MIFYKWRVWPVAGLVMLGVTLQGCASLEPWLEKTGLKPAPSVTQTESQQTEGKQEKEAAEKEVVYVESYSSSAGQAEVVLGYLKHFQGLSEARQTQEFERVKVDYKKSGSFYDRFRLASIALLPNRPFSDPALVVKLLKETPKDKQLEDGLRGLQVLFTLLAEQQQGLERKLADERTKAETLARQLKELKDIEKILSEREKQTLPAK